MTEPENSIYVLSLDAKDIYISNNYIAPSPIGYNVRRKNDEINTYKLINTLDYSIDLIKLKEVYEKVYRRTNFSFFHKNKEYTQRVINVTFKYSNKEYNAIRRNGSSKKTKNKGSSKQVRKAYSDAGENIYVKFGYCLDDLILDDSVCIRDGELIAIQTNTEVDTVISKDILGKYFYYDKGCYNAKSNIKALNTVAELRNNLYENGFTCDGIKYVRYKRSSGSSRVGKCLFIDENLYTRMHKWEMCGLDIKEDEIVDLAALESYISLTLSSIIDTTEINKDNILIIKDYYSVFKDDVVVTGIENGWLKTYYDNIEINNNIWDGQSLIDKSAMGNYSNYGFILLRNRFFKSACFNCNLQQWFSDNGITDISQLNGFTLANDIKDIKLITTPSSIKYLKFGTLDKWLDCLEPMFGIVKHEKPTHFFKGRFVQTHYQLLNTLQLTQEEVNEFLYPSLEYLRMLKTDPCVLRYHIKYNEDQGLDNSPCMTKKDIIYKMLGINSDFSKTKLYHEFKTDTTSSFVKNMRCGHILVNGNYSTLIGNPIEMLLFSIGKFTGESQIGIGNIHSTRFGYGKKVLGSRSPHVCAGNILVSNNTENAEIDKYLNLTDEIVCVNSICENLLYRLSGCD